MDANVAKELSKYTEVEIQRVMTALYYDAKAHPEKEDISADIINTCNAVLHHKKEEKLQAQAQQKKTTAPKQNKNNDFGSYSRSRLNLKR